MAHFGYALYCDITILPVLTSDRRDEDARQAAKEHEERQIRAKLANGKMKSIMSAEEKARSFTAK